MENTIINCHTHIFNRMVVPENFLPKWLSPIAKLLENKKTSKFMFNLFGNLNRDEIALLIKKYHAFLTIGDLKSQLEIFKYLQTFYPTGTKFCTLSMDMEFMRAGKVKQSFIDQLNEMAKIKSDPAYNDLIYPFIFVHPERKGIFDIVQLYIEEAGFKGIKLYPPLGYYPFDDRLTEIYQYAERNKIPITTHCARGGIFYKGEITDDMRKHPKTGIPIKAEKNKFFTDTYTNPENYKYVLQRFPGLILNLAHFGGYDEWQKYLGNSFDQERPTWYESICELIRKYDNVYTDISYTMFNADLFNLLKLSINDNSLKDKILYGSDYYMVEQETSERQFLTNVRAHIGEDLFWQIAQINPMKFLNGFI
jgi:predicted TIM-barrel fold metal-dependent hydrolase